MAGLRGEEVLKKKQGNSHGRVLHIGHGGLTERLLEGIDPASVQESRSTPARILEEARTATMQKCGLPSVDAFCDAYDDPKVAAIFAAEKEEASKAYNEGRL